MSYDLSIGDEAELNYTYNVGPMWRKVTPNGIKEIHDLSGVEAVPVLLHMYIGMVHREKELRQMNPENGWGNYDGALDFIHRALQLSMKHPFDFWVVG